MSERGKNESLSDILEAIKRIQSYISGLDYEAFLKDFKTSDAVVRNLEVIGEAAKNIDEEFRGQGTVNHTDHPQLHPIQGIKKRSL